MLLKHTHTHTHTLGNMLKMDILTSGRVCSDLPKGNGTSGSKQLPLIQGWAETEPFGENVRAGGRPTNDGWVGFSFVFSSQGNPLPSLHAVSFFLKQGWSSPPDLTSLYLTDTLWGLMKSCLQYFQFLEKNIYRHSKYCKIYKWSRFLVCCYAGVLFSLSL